MYRILSLLFLTFFSLFTTFRLSFFGYFCSRLSDVTFSTVMKAFVVGARFDLRLIALILLPFALFGAVTLRRAAGSSQGINPKMSPIWNCWRGYFLFCTLLTTLLIIFDFGHFSYLGSRLSWTVWGFSTNVKESAMMLWQSYAVIRIGLFWIILNAIIGYFTFRKILTVEQYQRNAQFMLRFRHKKKTRWAMGTSVGFGLALCLYGSLSAYPLRWSEAHFTPNSFISSLALNPVLYFLETMEFSGAEYDVGKVKEHYDQVAAFLGVKPEDRNKDRLNFKRSYNPAGIVKRGAGVVRPPNVVVIVLESMAAFKSGTFGNPLGATPALDKLAKEGLLFRHFYVPSQATARSIFGLVSGTPDITQKKSSSRNPMVVKQHTVIEDLTGYEKYYFLGGSANWGNIRGIFSNNVEGIKIYEEGKFEKSSAFDIVDVWGISDYTLFEEANAVFRRSDEGLPDRPQELGKPFFAVIQTSGYHRPYTIPSGHRAFHSRTNDEKENGLTLTEEQMRRFGFETLKEYNSIRFQDFSLGHFFEIARKEKYFENTIFMVFGDHGLPVNGAENVAAGEKLHNFPNFHVPFIIYSPKYFKPAEDQRFVSEVDVLPTVAGILGKPYTTHTFGRDMFDSQFDDRRQVFNFFWYETPPTFGVIDAKYYLLSKLGNQDNLYFWNGPEPEKAREKEDPAAFEKNRQLSHGLYETAKYLLYHNH